MALQFPPTAIASSSAVTLIAFGSSVVAVAAGPAPVPISPVESRVDPKAQATALIRKLAISDDSTLAVSCHDDKILRVWDIKPRSADQGVAPALVAEPRSSRTMFKRAASVSFTRDNSIVVTDKVGDVYLYPLEPREAPPAPQGFKVQADPSLNPDADFLLGHVSVVSQHVLSPDERSIITADRDEHIRVSRFPKAYVIERYLFGSEGFVSAIHIPASRPDLLLSAGGEPTMQLWDWEKGALLSRIDFFPAVLPYRRVRPSPRRLRKKRAAAPDAPAPSDDPANPGFYVAAEGMTYPTGQGVCVERIDSYVVGDNTVVVFFAEGCTAVHAFVLPPTPEEKPTIHTQSFTYPVLGIARREDQLVVALDSSYGLKKGDAIDPARANSAFAVVDMAADGSLSDVSATSPLAAQLNAACPATAPVDVLAGLALFPNLSLFPRWPGFEEDEELAGPAEDLAGMNGKQLGRLKAQGADVPQDLLGKKAKKRKGNKGKVAEGAEPEVEGEDAGKGEASEQASVEA